MSAEDKLRRWSWLNNRLPQLCGGVLWAELGRHLAGLHGEHSKVESIQRWAERTFLGGPVKQQRLLEFKAYHRFLFGCRFPP